MRTAMLTTLSLTACLAVCLAVFAPSGWAQEGHPLTGTWTGDWGTTTTERNHLTFVLSFDGDKVSGIINPGANSVELTSVVVNYSTWRVRFEAGEIHAEGLLEDIGSAHRKITGTWRQGTMEGDFVLIRD